MVKVTREFIGAKKVSRCQVKLIQKEERALELVINVVQLKQVHLGIKRVKTGNYFALGDTTCTPDPLPVYFPYGFRRL
jgi:hypothetical protein